MKKLKILILSAHYPSEMTSGMGLILGNSITAMIKRKDIKVVLGTITQKVNDANNYYGGSKNNKIESYKLLYNIKRSTSSRIMIVRSLIKWLLTKSERSFLKEIKNVSKFSDIAVWFSSSWDPLSFYISKYCKCPVVHHPNDSITRFERMRKKNNFKAIRLFLARYQERRIINSGFKGIIYVSEKDANEAYNYCLKKSNIKIIDLPNGVDIDYFKPCNIIAKTYQKPLILLFTGALDYIPNLEAAEYLVKEIIPPVKSKYQLRLVGKSSSPKIYSLGKEDGSIIVTGWVSNIAEEYQAADIFIAPMISGTGFKNKIIEAMSCGLPILATDLALSGFKYCPPGVLKCKTPNDFASKIDYYAKYPQKRKLLGKLNRKFIINGWSWQDRTNRMISFLKECM